MNRKTFAELLRSVEEMDAIAAGTEKPKRRFEFSGPDVRAIRKRNAGGRERNSNPG